MSGLSIELLRELLVYDPHTGMLWWKARKPEHFAATKNKSAESLCKWWNGRFAGTPALNAIGNHGCRHGKINGTLHYAHRVAWALQTGSWPVNDIDHEDGNRSSNLFRNMRDATHRENMQNKRRYRSNKTGHPGVSFRPKSNKWQAFIGGSGGRTYLGTFDTFADAVQARKQAEAAHGFHPNHGRAA